MGIGENQGEKNGVWVDTVLKLADRRTRGNRKRKGEHFTFTEFGLQGVQGQVQNIRAVLCEKSFPWEKKKKERQRKG